MPDLSRPLAFACLMLASAIGGMAHAQYAPLPGTPEKLGKVDFPITCSAEAQQHFTRGVALYHSYYWPEARKAFAATAAADPACAMAHWGHAIVIMGNAFAWPLTGNALGDGWAAIRKAKSLNAKSARERDYIGAVEAFFRDGDKVPARTRQLAYEVALEKMTRDYPDDREAVIFHAHVLSANYDPGDKAYGNQLKAATILEKLFVDLPDHPGVAHYLIHSYDYPPLAERGLRAAYRYRDIAPSAPHALHMPSHTFTRLGLWEDSIASNSAVIRTSNDPTSRLHSWDYMAYAFLQLGRDSAAGEVLSNIRALAAIKPDGLAPAFALAAIPARFALERGRWADAAKLTLQPNEFDFPWQQFPHAQAVHVYARGLGLARSGDANGARAEITRLRKLKEDMIAGRLLYWADQADIQSRAIEAWSLRAEGRHDDALAAMRTAADHEDRTEKSAVTPGPVKPARELLGEMLLEMQRPAAALSEFETAMKKEPNRYRALAGAARAAELAGDAAKARTHYTHLAKQWEKADAGHPEQARFRSFLASQ